MRSMILSRLAAGICAWAVSVAVPAFSAEAPRGETAVTCTNVASGTNWQIRIDYDKGTVDANPARISDDLPAPDGPYTVTQRLVTTLSSSRWARSSRPKKRSRSEAR